MWGRLVTCGGLAIRLVMCKKIVRPIANRPQDAILPHKSKCDWTKSSRRAKNKELEIQAFLPVLFLDRFHSGDVIFCELRISCKNLLSGLPCCKLLKHEINRNSRALQARLTQHHIRTNLDVLWQFHSPTIPAIGTKVTVKNGPHVPS
jgi:hypothetical protein